MIFDLVSSSGACSETDSVSCRSRSASASNFSVIPQVDSDMCRMPIFIPCGWFTSSRKRMTLSKLSSGSPMPIRTILDIGLPESSCENSTSSSISDGSRQRTRPPMVEAQNAQP